VEKTQQFCSFFIKEQFFGISVEQVQEVIQYQETTRVPIVPEVIRGLINLRGQIVMAVDLRRRLEIEERPAGMLPVNVVVRTQEGPVSLLADSIGDVVEVGEQAFEDPPQTLQGSLRELIIGVHKLEGKLLHVLNTEKVCQIPQRRLPLESASTNGWIADADRNAYSEKQVCRVINGSSKLSLRRTQC